MNAVEKLELEAQKYMASVLKREDRFSNEFIGILEDMEADIHATVLMYDNISISSIESFISNEIVPIIDSYMFAQYDYLETSITNQFGNGFNHAQSLLDLSPYEQDMMQIDNTSESYEEALFGLLLYARTLVISLNDDLKRKIHNDTISSYVMSKKENGSAINNATRSDRAENTINTVLSGTIISMYIKSTFKNIRNRANFIARTETNRALNHGHLLNYIGADIKWVKWVEVRDNRLCSHCKKVAEDNNGIYNINYVSPPPLHPNCRCILIPYDSNWINIIY